MKIDRKEAAQVAHLARLHFDEEELERCASQLSTILEYFEKLKTIDTSQIEPTSHLFEMDNVFRNDEVRDEFERDILHTNAPAREHDYFKVPKIIE